MSSFINHLSLSLLQQIRQIGANLSHTLSFKLGENSVSSGCQNLSITKVKLGWSGEGIQTLGHIWCHDIVHNNTMYVL